MKLLCTFKTVPVIGKGFNEYQIIDTKDVNKIGELKERLSAFLDGQEEVRCPIEGIDLILNGQMKGYDSDRKYIGQRRTEARHANENDKVLKSVVINVIDDYADLTFEYGFCYLVSKYILNELEIINANDEIKAIRTFSYTEVEVQTKSDKLYRIHHNRPIIELVPETARVHTSILSRSYKMIMNENCFAHYGDGVGYPYNDAVYKFVHPFTRDEIICTQVKLDKIIDDIDGNRMLMFRMNHGDRKTIAAKAKDFGQYFTLL